jgi:hypothetical protein
VDCADIDIYGVHRIGAGNGDIVIDRRTRFVVGGFTRVFCRTQRKNAHRKKHDEHNDKGGDKIEIFFHRISPKGIKKGVFPYLIYVLLFYCNLNDGKSKQILPTIFRKIRFF